MTYLTDQLIKPKTYRVFATARVKFSLLQQQPFLTHITTVASVPVVGSPAALVTLLPALFCLLFTGHMVVPYEQVMLSRRDAVKTYLYASAAAYLLIDHTYFRQAATSHSLFTPSLQRVFLTIRLNFSMKY